MMNDGKLKAQDEVCPANGFWITLSDREDVQTVLGVSALAADTPPTEEEVTETEIGEERTDPNLRKPARSVETAGTGTVQWTGTSVASAPKLEKFSAWTVVAWVLIGVLLVLGFFVVRMLLMKGS